MALTLEMYIKQEAKKLVDDITNDPEFKKSVNEEFAKICDPYVPYITGELSKNITITSQGISYNQPYASNVYDSMGVHNKEHHPLASSMWDEVAFANHKDELTAKTKELILQWIKTKQ